MDPNANLFEQRRIIARILDTDRTVDDTDVQRLAELARALDEWVRSGGSIPLAWVQ